MPSFLKTFIPTLISLSIVKFSTTVVKLAKVLLDILSFTKQLNKNISEKVLWPKLYDRMIRNKPFLNYNLTKYKMTLKRKLNV